MENVDVAKLFWEIAELLEFKEENPFRIRSYQKAAQNIESLSENIEEISKRGELEKIPGVGKGTAEKIEELIKTGKLKYHQELLKEFPPGLLQLMEVEGVGPKLIMLAYHKLNIKNIDQLEKSLKKGKFRDLPGMGAKKEEKILKGIAQYRQRKGRFTLSTAFSYADAIVAQLKKLPEVEQIIPAGSLRRMKETIGDVDILVTSQKPEKIMHAFVHLPQVKEILAQGPTKSSVMTKIGLHVDVRVVKPKSFGAALHYFTGSKQHNIRIRELGVKKGLKINEYGIFKAKTNKRMGGKTEEEVFKAVGLPYIPPELRETRGEIEAARKGKLPKLIDFKNILGDLHIHSKWSDGAHSISELAEAAKKIGYKYIAITDHTKSTRVAGGLSEKEILEELKEIDKINKKLKDFRILKGVEIDILPDGKLDYNDNILKRFDVVIAAVHAKFGMEKEAMTKRVISALKNKYVNILAHPTGRLLGRREPYQIDLDKIVKVAKDTGTFIELNAYPERLDLDDLHCKHAKELGVGIAINTDAHTIPQLEYMRFGIATAKRGWLEAKNVINTLPLEKLLRKLYQKR